MTAPLTAFKFWMKMLSTYLDALFPTTIALLALAPFNREGFKRGRALWLMLAALCIGLGMRLGLFMFGLPSERRYLLSLAALAAVFAAPGFEVLARLVCKALPKIGGGKVVWALLAALLLVCAGKGLNPSFEKQWMKDAARLVSDSSRELGKRPVIITDSDDRRIAYYAGAMYVKLCLGDDENPVRKYEDNDKFLPLGNGILAVNGRRKLSKEWVALEGSDYGGMAKLAENIRRLEGGGAKVFVLVEMKEDRLRGLFKMVGAEFPLKEVKSFKDRKGRGVLLYELSDEVRGIR